MNFKKLVCMSFALAACATANAQSSTQPATQVSAAQESQREGVISSSNNSRDTIACLADPSDTEMCAATATSGGKKVSPGLYAAHAGFKKVYKRSVGLTGGHKYIVLEVGN